MSPSPLPPAAHRLAFAATLCLTMTTTACDIPSPFTIFTALAYTSDGQALLLEATDGIYLASPPDDTPHRLGDSQTPCDRAAGQYALGCARLAPSGDRLVLLRGKKEAAADASSAAPTWDLWLFGRGAGGGDGTRVAEGVLDATFTPDGAELLWIRLEPDGDGRPALFRLAEDGSEARVLDAIDLGERDDAAKALSALIITSVGVGHTRASFSGVSLWFQPFGGRAPRELGGVAAFCVGSSLSSCSNLSQDGVTFAWQESSGSLLQLYRGDIDVRLPLGPGVSFRFSRTGALLLRYVSKTAYVHRADTAAVVRTLQNVNAAQLSADGESLAHLAVVSTGMQTSQLRVGPARQSDADGDYGLLAAPTFSPLWVSVAGSDALPFSFTGDGGFVIAAVDLDPDLADEAGGALVAMDVRTSEARVLDELSCYQCCQIAQTGALVLCSPPDPTSLEPRVFLDVYDPATGLRTRGADSLIDYEVNRDGTAVVLTDYASGTPKLKVITKAGQVISMGTAYKFALSPTENDIAYINEYGKLSFKVLP
ncbi:MAG: hypothetical protein LBM75_08965 [Myxococcales bacterium]|jgi:hypothetical protein|nr:hypothetical protein [Myxococcales bacterium]